MGQQEVSMEGAPIYVTANALVSDSITLEDAMQIARDAGANGFELRRELLPLPLQSAMVERIRSQLQQFSSPPAYSLPRSIFTDRRFEPEPLLQAFSEARSFGCRLVKFSPIGVDPVQASQHPGGLTSAIGQLRTLLEREANGLVVTVENDQSAVSSDLDLWESFFEQARAVECPIWMTFDLGNWTCVGSDPVQAAQRLGRYVAYMHAKAVERKDGQCISRPFRMASTPHPALAYLPPEAPRAIEFPLAGKTHEAVSTALRTYILWLRSGNFVV
jgi:sugar phosphate isomerase/epimerase